MTFTYPAVMRQTAEGGYTGYFPDLEGCVFSGATLDEAINAAIEAEKCWIDVEMEEEQEGFGIALPFVSVPEDIALQEGEFIRNIAVIMHFEVGFY